MKKQTSNNITIEEHVTELKKYIVKITKLFTFFFIIGLILAKTGIGYIYNTFDFESYNIKLIMNSPFDAINLYFHYAIIFSLIFVCPLIIWYAYKFLIPAVDKKLHVKTKILISISMLLFLVGVYVGYKYIILQSFEYILFFAGNTGFETYWSINKLLSLMINTPLLIGLIFQYPLLLLTLIYSELLDVKSLIDLRKFIILVFALISGIITPSPDIYTQIILMIPLYLLYELTIITGMILKMNKHINIKRLIYIYINKKER